MAIDSMLQQLFHEPIERIKYLDPGYWGNTSVAVTKCKHMG
ncbi:MAG: hypothetical protein K0R28_276 [Paenibacillus sp.]|nr:hypothetical protein [Paenibacillus sp.]